MNNKRSRQTAVMIFVLSLLAVYAALQGVLDEKVYTEVFLAGTISKFMIYGSQAQDIISVISGIILAVLSLIFIKNPQPKNLIVILALTGYFFYGFGLYTIQGQYTSIYLVYMAIFALAVYSLIWGLISFEPETVKNYSLPVAMRISISVFLVIILVILVPVWLLRISPDIARHAPGDTYGVFIMDLCIVFPAFGIIAVQLLLNRPFGNILAGLALVKTLTLCLSVAFGEWFVSFFGGYQADYGMIVIFSALTLFSLLLSILYLVTLKRV